jgi:hypothetical protein
LSDSLPQFSAGGSPVRLDFGGLLHFTQALHKVCHDIGIPPSGIIEFGEVSEASIHKVNP